MARVNATELKAVQQMLGLLEPDTPGQWKDIVFVCIDCEAHEFDHSKTTEIGASVLDMKNVPSLADLSTSISQELISKMQHSHYRIVEYGKLVNHRFVKGWPQNFNFGQTVWVKRADAQDVLSRIFRDPASLASAHQPGEAFDRERKIVIVGHDISNDASYLKHLGFDLKAVLNVVRKFDTQLIAGSKKRSVGLSKLLRALDVEAQYLHNAGNDAAYTLQALILMAVNEFQNPGSVSVAIEQQRLRAGPVATENGVERPNRRERKRLMRLHQQGETGQTIDGGSGEQNEDAIEVHQASSAVPAFGHKQIW